MRYVVLLISIMILTLPGFVLGGVPLRLEDFIVIFLLIYFIVYHKGSLLIDKGFNFLLILFLLFIFSNFLSLFLAVLNGYDIIFQDINTIFLYLKSVVFLFCGYMLGVKLTKVKLNSIYFILSFGIVLSCVASIIQYFNIMGLGERLYVIYGKEERIVYGIQRAIGTLNNPNYAAYFHVIGFIFVLNIKAVDGRSILYKYIFLFFMILGTLLTFSRTGLISLVIAWFLVLFLHKKIRGVIYLLASLIILYGCAHFLIKGTRFEELLLSEHGGDLSNFGRRSDLIWQQKIEQFYEYPLLGKGPSKNEISDTIFSVTIYDNVFLLLLLTSGIIGFLLYMTFNLRTLFLFFKYRSRFPYVVCAIVPIMIVTFIFFITTDLIWNIKFIGFYYLVVGMFYSYIFKIKS